MLTGYGYIRGPKGGVTVKPAYERAMHRLWDRSSVMYFGDWDPPKDKRGNPTGPRWHEYYEKRLRSDVRSGRLEPTEASRLKEYLDILGT